MPTETLLSIHQQMLDCMRVEARSINLCAERLDPVQTEKAVRLLLQCQGKVVVLGVGKSGIIAHKIAATLSSTGTPAIHLHASDAVHGDLGLVDGRDVVIAISNSGATDEIVALLPHLQLRKVPLIAVVGNTRSTLAAHAVAVLDTSIDREACPLNLAPTTSTTVALAVGDALAMTLMTVKGITTEHFAINHPAGKLGKRLALKVADLMHTGDRNPTTPADTRWSQIIDRISKGNLGAISVTGPDGTLLGIITDGDLRRLAQKFPVDQFESLTAAQIMTARPVVAQPHMLAYDALQLMEKRSAQITVLPVTDEAGRVAGLIHIHDIIGKL
jgi:arabinose-5-phosphate isomerase